MLVQTGQNILLGAGQDPWLGGVRAYLRAHAYNTSASGQLWQALSGAVGRNVGAWMQGWTYRAGYPLLVVSLGGPQGRDLLLSQVLALFILHQHFCAYSPGDRHQTLVVQLGCNFQLVLYAA